MTTSSGIEITSTYGVVSIKDDSIAGHVFLGYNNGDWQEWRVIEKLVNRDLGYKKIKINLKAAASFFLKEEDTSVLCSDVSINDIDAEVCVNEYTDTAAWEKSTIEKNDVFTVKELIRSTLGHYIRHSSNTSSVILLLILSKQKLPQAHKNPKKDKSRPIWAVFLWACVNKLMSDGI